MNIAPFGEIRPDDLEEDYDGEVNIAGRTVPIDLNFESEFIDEGQLVHVNGYVSRLESESRKAIEAISDDWDLGNESETARFYLRHHLNEFSQEEIQSLFGTQDVDKAAFMRALNLERIGLYPEDDESFAVFDIQFPKETTTYLMAVTFDRDGRFSCISMDS